MIDFAGLLFIFHPITAICPKAPSKEVLSHSACAASNFLDGAKRSVQSATTAFLSMPNISSSVERFAAMSSA